MDKEAIEIGRYIKGEMAEAERIDFETRMDDDPFLGEAVAGFQKDPGALFDLPINTNLVTIQWWGTLIGVFAVAVVFLLIPQKVIDVPILAQDKNYTVHEELEREEPAVVELIEVHEYIENASAEIDWSLESAKIEESIDLEADRIFIKPAKLYVESEVPALKVEEKIIFILDLKVVKTAQKDETEPLYELSDLTDFTPANFSTTTAFKRAEKNKGIFPEPHEPTYLERIERGLKYLKSEDYSSALRIFSLILKENNQDVNAIFYSALSRYKLGNYELATRDFAKVEGLANQAFIPESEWYRALSLEKLGRKAEARGLLLKIANEGGHYAERARALLIANY